MPATRQLRLLLWKDYLTRKRKLITLAGVVWATAVMLSIYIVRANVDNSDYPTCQFPARALPSAGMLPFLQSFICSVNNDCETLDKFQEIPTYEDSKLTQLERQFAPLIYNDTVLEVAGTVPDALKLLSKLADIADEPTFVDISKNGLKVRDVFSNPSRVKRYLSSRLQLQDDVTDSLMTSQLSFQGLFKGTMNRCSLESMSETLVLENKEHMAILVDKLCSLTDKDVQKMLGELMIEINFNKFIKMIGNMYYKLSGDHRVTELADTVTAVLRVTRLQNFLPKELVSIVQGEESEFTYIDLELIQKFINLFEPTFGETDSFKSIKDVADTIVVGIKYLNKFLSKQTNINKDNSTKDGKTLDVDIETVNKALSDAVEVMEETSSIDIFNVLSQVTKLIHKFLPDDLKHEVLLYSTLLTKLIEGANKVISTNMNIEERAYNVSLRHPEGVKVLVNLPSSIVAKGFDGLADAERTQVMTAKIAKPGQMFCDPNRLQIFFKISKDEASSLYSQLCTDAWKDFVTDLIKTFGIYEVKDNINAMASLLIQETLGKDTTDQLYTIDYEFQVLKNFTNSLTRMTSAEESTVDWMKIFNVTEESVFMKTVRSKGHLGKQMLIVVHGALAKEVVRQNPILSYKISSGLIDTTTLVTALSAQLDSTSEDLVRRVKERYPAILETVVRTANDEIKTLKSLSTHSEDIMCNGLDNAISYLKLPEDIDKEELVATLCDISAAIENGLRNGSLLGKALNTIRTSKHTAFEEVKWTTLINGLKNLYVKLNTDYPYLFEYNTYGLSEESKIEVAKMAEDAKRMWFGDGSLGKSVHLGLKFGFRLLDLIDRDIFNISSSGWEKMKYSLHALTGHLTVFDDVVRTVTAIYRNESVSSNLPAKTVDALERIVPNIPQLIFDAVDILVRDETELAPIISLLNSSPPWPCDTSLSAVLPLSPRSVEAVKGLETIWCMDSTFTEEWKVYLDDRSVVAFDIKKWNTTVFPPHVFLRFSAAFDDLIEDGNLLRSLAEDISKESDDEVSWIKAWEKIREVFRREDRDAVVKRFLSKFDTALSSIMTDGSPSALYLVWSDYLACHNRSGDCSSVARVTWKRSLQFIGLMFKDAAEDLLEYFREIQEPNANALQMLGFTRTTRLYELYDKMADFMGVLLHSYWDFGFMSQVRRAAHTHFWDCEAVLEALVPPPGSRVTSETLLRIKPYVCPSFLYWLSLPRGDNKLLDVLAKPQYYFFTLPADNFTSNYEEAYTALIDLTTVLRDINNKNQTLITEEDVKINSIQYKFEKFVDKIVNYKIDENDTQYLNFYDINKKHIATSVYLTRVVAMVNNIAIAIDTLKSDDVDSEDKVKIEADLSTIAKLYKRRPVDVIQLHFDLLTDVIWQNNEGFTLLNALETACNDFKANDTRKVILVDNKRVINIVCSKLYQDIYKAVENTVGDDYEDARESLLNLIKIQQNGGDGNVSDIVEFFKQRPQLVTSLQTSIKHSYELHLPIYLQYLQSNLRHYDVIASFLSGGEWWGELRGVYNGPRAVKFFDAVEISFEIAEDVIGGLDRIHLVRLLRDINVNNTEAFCLPNITLSDYLPDGTGRLSELKTDLCVEDATELFREIPPLLFVSQGYDSDLRLSPEINYTMLNLDIARTASNLDLMGDSPRSPQWPPWVTDDKVKHFRGVAVKLLSKESLTRIAFGVISNIVDAGTLFLNNSECAACSQLTSWLKQLNLQVFKKQEYDGLLCRMSDMALADVHRALQNDFHWDMAVRELIQTRNYTKLELNKSLNEFLELIKLHLLEDMAADTTKLAHCLTHNVSRNALGNVTLVLSILSHTARLLRAEAPHLQEVDGITTLPYFRQLSSQISRNLDVNVPLKKYVRVGVQKELQKLVGDEGEKILGGDVNLRLVNKNVSVSQYITLKTGNWSDVCTKYDCEGIAAVVQNYINRTLVDEDLPTLQTQQFFTFSFVSGILYRIEGLVGHCGRLLGVFSRVDVSNVLEGRLAALVDFVLLVLRDDVAADIIYSLHGLVEELSPLLRNTSLEHDLQALGGGLAILHTFKNYLLQNDLKLEVSSIFPSGDVVESSLGRLGINNTNFWSLAAPRLALGHIDLKPLFTQNHLISEYVCQMDTLSSVLRPGNLDVVTAEDVTAAVVEQWCALGDDTAKQAVAVLLQNVNYTVVFEEVSNILLPLLYSSANLTQSEGSRVFEMYPRMVALLPAVRGSAGGLGEVAGELRGLGGGGSIGGMLGSPEFLQNAGRMLCGKPFQTDQNRFYKAIAQSEDFSSEPDQAQLDVLPTDFCRSMYKDILSMGGGKIVWTFVKPLIMGKILYTPANPTVDRIIQQANSSFAHMIKLINIVHSFANSLPSLGGLSVHRGGLTALRDVIASPALRGVRDALGGGDVPDVEGMFEFGDLEHPNLPPPLFYRDIIFQGLGSILKKGSDLLHCINLDRFQSVPDEFQLTRRAVQLSRVNEFSAGLVFLNSDRRDYYRNVEYKIRMDIDNVPTTARMKNYLWVPGPESSFIEHMRYFRGFIQIQDMVGSAVIQLSRSNTSRSKRETRTEDKWAVYTQQEPYPCYKKDFFQTSLYESQALMVALFFSLLFTVASIVRFIVEDKESGNTMLMSVMGVNLTYHTLSWFLISLLELCVTSLCIVAVLFAGGILPHTDPSLVLALLIVFGVAVLAFCYMMSKLFNSASVAAVCSAIAYLMTFMPFVLILSLEAVIGVKVKLLVCLSMSTSICYAFLNITRWEAHGAGARWARLWDSADGGLSIGGAAAMALLDAALYVAVGFLLDRFFGPKTLKSNITNCTTSNEKAGVSVVGVSKVYAAGGRREKIALDNVSIELHKGQVTTLLGHNGAGKTTLINILTGMTRPTQGKVVIRSEPALGTQVGVCPQGDVLFECLSAAEHVALYAQLKSGLPKEMVQDEIDSILRVLSLGRVCSEPVSRLSGGSRRRVCVSLAFVCRPQLVTLDEPTAGVDPAARRDIWSMIVKLRENRTILMTTHHLDEAELLSDQIVIMHKGQVHTTGSPIDIKRSLGNGYKLSVIYPKVSDPWPEEFTLEERIKQLMGVVRDTVKNASLVDVNGLEVEIGLPFFDVHGINNDFLQLCTSLERCQPELSFGSFALDCASLEQVFFDICSERDAPAHPPVEYDPEMPSKSASTSSVRSDNTPLVPAVGPLRGASHHQLLALLHARYIHYTRNRWLLFMLIVLPSLFVATAMGFSLIRPPADNEVSLALTPDLYPGTTQYIVSQPSIYSDIDPSFAQSVLDNLKLDKNTRHWTEKDTPNCTCAQNKQQCEGDGVRDHPEMMVLPDATALNQWIVATHDSYIERRYTGYSAAVKNNSSYLIAWYNNKGHHSMPAAVAAVHSALLRAGSGHGTASLSVSSHPLKISREQLSKDTVYQHIADAGISGLVLIAYSLVSAGGAIYLVTSRRSQQKRLQLLCGVSPAMYCMAALIGDMIIIVINMVITIVVFEAFGFPVFVARSNLPAICLLILLYGYACSNLTQLVERAFSEASLANMALFCGNAFVGLAGIALLLILDIISDSDATDNARWVVHKILLVCPQFVLGDGMLEVAKNTIQAQVLTRFGMDTYRDPLTSDLLRYHYLALAAAGSALLLLTLAVEYGGWHWLLDRFHWQSVPEGGSGEEAGAGELEDVDVSAERRRVHEALSAADRPLRLSTLQNINAGYVDTEIKHNSITRVVSTSSDAASCVRLSKAFPSAGGRRLALADLTLGIPSSQCTALLGENGAGKSTTFSLLTGELRPSGGQVWLGGRPQSPRGLCRGLISYCPQSDAVDRLLTVRETLACYCRLRGIDEPHEVIKRTLEMFDLTKYSEVRSGALSGGNRRKLCTALAFMGRAPLVLLDEPTSGMDPLSRWCVWRGVTSSLAARRAVLLSTHALQDAGRLAARVALLRGGRLRALAPLAACLHRFGGGYVVSARCGAAARGVWRRVAAAAPHARLTVRHHAALHFLLPARATVEGKEVVTSLSDVFRLMASLQAACDIEEFTVSRSSLEQMFLNFTDKGDVELDPTDLEPLPSLPPQHGDELDTITSL